MHSSMLRWCIKKIIRTTCIIVATKQIRLQIYIFSVKILSFVYYQGHLMFEYKCMNFAWNIFCVRI